MKPFPIKKYFDILEYSLFSLISSQKLLRLRKSVIAGSCDGSGKLIDGVDGWCDKVKDVCKHYQDGLDGVI